MFESSDESDSDDQLEAKPAGSSASRGMMPVRVERVERKDRKKPPAAPNSKLDRKRAIRDLEQSTTVLTSTEAGEESSQHAKEEKPAIEEHKWKGVYDDDEEEEAATNVKSDAISGEGVAPNAASSPVEERKPRARKHSGPELQTEEERAERARHMDDLETIVHELGQVAFDDADSDAAMADGAEKKVDPRADKVYLFQFPPIMPDLKSKDSVIDLDQSDEAAPVPKPDASPEIKIKPDLHAEEENPVILDPKPERGGMQLPSGRVGKMRVHASGKVTFDWGGTSFQVGMGTNVDFLQQVVMTKRFEDGRTKAHTTGPARPPNAPPQDREVRSDVREPEGEVGGEAMALGQIRGKFIVQGNWDDII